jgi:multidrug efflux pump subunit AcrA (membrane-fusion protein)
MTVFGKILTFVILVLALAQAALHVMFHIAQANYVSALDKATTNAKVAVAEAESWRAQYEKAVQDRDAALAKKQGEIDTLTAQLTDAKAGKEQAEQTIAGLQTNFTKVDAAQKADQANINRHALEVKSLNAAIETRDKQIRDMLLAVNQFRDDSVKSKMEANDYKFRNEQMVELLKEKEQEIVALKTKSPGSGLGGPLPGGPGGAGSKNPPSANIEGLITQTDPSSGMVTISVGSDAGVVKGNTMEVFRLNPPKYLGTLRIVETKPNEAVGRPMSKPLGPIMQGDHVASKILGG